MNIDVNECAMSCFRTCVKTASNGIDYVSLKNYVNITKKIELAINLYKEMHKRDEMIGVKFIPIEIKEKFTNRQNISIQIKYSKYQ
ncbi:hypothetical protein AGMMS49531_04110 [Endomicrobiia bacterium]|nr:hypothetical protein AGMMS49531_04110 [Endomicrobiia bacterium]